jgi:hypothetical protein
LKFIFIEMLTIAQSTEGLLVTGEGGGADEDKIKAWCNDTFVPLTNPFGSSTIKNNDSAILLNMDNTSGVSTTVSIGQGVVTVGALQYVGNQITAGRLLQITKDTVEILKKSPPESSSPIATLYDLRNFVNLQTVQEILAQHAILSRMTYSVGTIEVMFTPEITGVFKVNGTISADNITQMINQIHALEQSAISESDVQDSINQALKNHAVLSKMSVENTYLSVAGDFKIQRDDLFYSFDNNALKIKNPSDQTLLFLGRSGIFFYDCINAQDTATVFSLDNSEAYFNVNVDVNGVISANNITQMENEILALHEVFDHLSIKPDRFPLFSVDLSMAVFLPSHQDSFAVLDETLYPIMRVSPTDTWIVGSTISFETSSGIFISLKEGTEEILDQGTINVQSNPSSMETKMNIVANEFCVRTISNGDNVMKLNDSIIELNKNVTIEGDLRINGNISANNFDNLTITHRTDIEDFKEEQIGRFCETNGGIYSGYSEITQTDCICQVKKSVELNSKIVGIMIDDKRFASHGDVLVKVIDGVYQLGDLLVPDVLGARVATQEEKVTIMLNGIPRVKITSLATNIDHVVACFIS